MPKIDLDLGFLRLDSQAFAAAPQKSIDYAVMEKIKRAAHAEDRLTVALAVNDLLIVTTPDAVPVLPRARAEAVKDAVALLRKQGRKEATVHRCSYRPWGHSDTLSTAANR